MRSPFDRPFGFRSPFGGQSGALSGAAALLATWADSNGGPAFDFSDITASQPYGSGKIIDGATPANNWETTPSIDPFDKLTFTRASTAYYYNSAGVLTQAGSGVARIDYDPSTLAVRGLLVEEARTNLVLYSTTTLASGWTAGGLTNLTTTTTGANGVSGSATLLNEDTSTGGHQISQNVAKAASAITYTLSFIAKIGVGRTRVAAFLTTDSFGNYFGAAFDLSGGQTSSILTAGASPWTSQSVSITPVGGGQYLCSLTGTSNATSVVVAPYIYSDNGSGTAAISNSFTGVVGNGCYVGDIQLEVGAFPTSRIPTTSATVTRAASADNLANTAFNLSQTTGTLYVSGITAPGSGTQVLASIDDGTANERYRIVRDSSNNLRFIVTDGGVEQANINLGAVTNSTAFKVAASWAANDFAACLNGGTVGTDTGGTLPTVTTLRLGCSPAGEQWGGHIKPAMHLPIALSDANLQSITA